MYIIEAPFVNMFLSIVFLLAVFSVGPTKESLVNVTLPLGVVTGVKNKTVRDGIEYIAFKGIRYAELQRFENAKPVKPWTGIYDATEDKPVCIQYGENTTIESENCLYLSVYTPKEDLSDTSKMLSVMFWIHGGTFLTGDSTYANNAPDYLLDQKVIVVTTNYRHGVFGFLSSGDNHLPGNYAIKDLIVALQFVQNNIAYFGGDPKQVTIFGQSAGSALLSYLTQSPLAQGKGYFIRAIAQSSSSLHPWAYQRHPVRVLQSVAELCKCWPNKLSNYTEVVKCLKATDLRVLKLAGDAVTSVGAAYHLDFFNGFGFAPVIEPYSKRAAVVKDIYSVLRTGAVPKVPMIIGSTSEEGLFVYNVLIRIGLAQLDLNNSLLVPEDMYAPENASRQFITPKIKQYYFNKGWIALASYEKIVRYFSDALYNKPFREYLHLIRNQPTCCYVFSYSPTSSKYIGISNVGHSGELDYLFKRDYNYRLTGKSLQASKNIVTLWANFAKYGNPTPTKDDRLGGATWPRAQQGGTDVRCMNITDKLQVIINPFDEQYKMRKTLYEKYGHPRDTYK